MRELIARFFELSTFPTFELAVLIKPIEDRLQPQHFVDDQFINFISGVIIELVKNSNLKERAEHRMMTRNDHVRLLVEPAAKGAFMQVTLIFIVASRGR